MIVPQDGTILDFGCGRAYWLIKIAESFFRKERNRRGRVTLCRERRKTESRQFQGWRSNFDRRGQV